jgi:acetyl esterase/lipase
VITFETGVTHAGSVRNLLGENPDPKLIELLSNELHVTPQTPPTFLFHTNADTGVLAENSVRFYLALRKAKVAAEMHIFENGPHGFGLALGDPCARRMAGTAHQLVARPRPFDSAAMTVPINSPPAIV